MSRKRKKRKWSIEARYELYGLLLILLSILAATKWGAVGRALRYLLRFLAGNWEFLLLPYLIGVGFFVMIRRKWPSFRSWRMIGGLLIFLSILIFAHLDLYQGLTQSGSLAPNIWNDTLDRILAEQAGPQKAIGGGLTGAFFFMILYYLFGYYGALLFTSLLALAGLMFLTGFTLKKGAIWIRSLATQIQSLFAQGFIRLGHFLKGKLIFSAQKRDQSSTEEGSSSEKPVIVDFAQRIHTEREKLGTEDRIPSEEGKIIQGSLPLWEEEKEESKREKEVEEEMREGEEDLQGREFHSYDLPPYTLLDKPKRLPSRESRDIANNIQKLEQTLKSFGVQARITNVHRGPAVTRYELQPDIGVKVSRIVNLTDDIALALAAKDIRMEAPIPGKAAIGIEVPNEHVSLVTLREVLESAPFHESSSRLTIALGRDISGEPIVGDLAKMPHLLVAGATGSGKSVCINSIISSILFKARPDEVKFIMVDPKMVELSIYNGVPHLLTPVVTDPKKASFALRKVVQEMERRYELFAHAGAKDLDRYNQMGGHPPLPYIVVIVDELADLMMVSPADVEDSITRLAQKARAAGIHLILATQRPSVDVITGVIKANIPSRIAFGVSSQVDSRTILDMAGAEKLLGKGDMLYLPVGSAKVTRIQGCFVSDREVEALVEFIKKQGEPHYAEELVTGEGEETTEPSMEDDLYEKAVQLVIESQTASVSLLQRRFRVGYARAARLIDMMEANGIVGPYEGSKPREVLVSKRDESQIS
ncbi:FtsK/SpoIIIE family DNA translocase [Thermicanus aegyptius]|uniref:FtsK/SpoIIIE family DNA translocase n=1 Tax=Thermicanus aegyptius TaxID=94009 RepID=UPI00048D38A5|nr:DNA translocase FtsK [Thermicanus aegyptius]